MRNIPSILESAIGLFNIGGSAGFSYQEVGIIPGLRLGARSGYASSTKP